MSALGDGDGPPDSNGPPEGLPGLPPDWGLIIVPDDAAELAAEAAALRREMRRQRRHGAPGTGPAKAPLQKLLATLRVPLLIMAVAVLAALASLFVVTRPGQQRQPATQRTASGTAASGRTLPALDLVDAKGGLVSLRSLLPAVIILTDGCACGAEISAALSAAPPGVTVVEVTSGRPAPSPPSHPPPAVASAVRQLADPASELHSFLQATPPAGAALLVARSGQVVRVLPTAAAVPDYPADLAQLASR